MIKNNKGITIVEIIISVTLISIVLILLLSVFITVRNEDERSKVTSNLLMNQVIITREIETDFINLGLIEVASCKDGGENADSVLSVLPVSSSIAKESKGHCLKLIYNPAKTKNNIGYLLYYSYGFSAKEQINVIGYVRGDKKALREMPALYDDYGIVNNSCALDYCALSISLPALNNDGDDYGIYLSYLYNQNIGFKITDLTLDTKYHFKIDK